MTVEWPLWSICSFLCVEPSGGTAHLCYDQAKWVWYWATSIFVAYFMRPAFFCWKSQLDFNMIPKIWLSLLGWKVKIIKYKTNSILDLFRNDFPPPPPFLLFCLITSLFSHIVACIYIYIPSAYQTRLNLSGTLNNWQYTGNNFTNHDTSYVFCVWTIINTICDYN